MLTVAIPVGIYLVCIYALYYYLVERFDPFHIWLFLGTAVVVALALVAAFSGVSMATYLIILMLASAVTVLGYEIRGYRHQAESQEKNI